MAGYPPCWLSYSSVHQQAWRESRHSENRHTVPWLSQIAEIMSWGYLRDNNDMQRKGVGGGFGNTNALLVYLGNQRIRTAHLKKIKCTIARVNLKHLKSCTFRAVRDSKGSWDYSRQNRPKTQCCKKYKAKNLNQTTNSQNQKMSHMGLKWPGSLFLLSFKNG